MARKALGRGLDALIPDEGKKRRSAGGGEGGPGMCDVGLISPGRLQPRQEFDQETLAQLAESIKSQGVLQPLLVRPRPGGKYELIAGERRLLAAKLAGLSQVPVLVREVDDRAALEISLIENIQREDLDPLEEAGAYQRLMTEFEYTQEQVSRRVGKDRATVANILRLLNLPGPVKEELKSGRITAGHARAILMAGSEKAMLSLCRAAVDQGLSVRETESRARREKKSEGKGKIKEAAKAPVHLRDMEEKMLRALGTKVKITETNKGGKIEIRFFSKDELDRIYRHIVRG